MNIGCIGCGTMGSAVMKAIAAKNEGHKFFVSSLHFEKAEAFAKEINGTACSSNADAAKQSDVIFLAVKPNVIESVLNEISSLLADKIVVSMAAGINLARLNSFAKNPGVKMFRIMPNLPAVYKEGMTALCVEEKISDDDIKTVTELLSSSGKVERVSEKLMDGVTAISGSGPAYGFMFIEALADAAVKFGIPRKQAYVYAAQTLKGAATMALEDERSISELKDAVCSPAGTTIDAVIALEANGFRNAVIQGAVAAYNKSASMGK